MLTKLTSYGKFGYLFCAIEHSFINQEDHLNGLILRKEKGEFLIEKEIACKSISDVSNLLRKEQHLFLIVNNTQVLSKKIAGVIPLDKAITQAFPNLNHDDFYVEAYNSSTSTFISICRIEYIDALLKEYMEHALNVIGFSIGNLTGSHLIHFIENQPVNTSNSTIHFSNQEITNIQPQADLDTIEYTINDLTIKNNLILPLAGIIRYYANQHRTFSNFQSSIDTLNTNFRQKRIFNVGLKASLAIVFILLLVSFLFYSSYASKIDAIQSELEMNNTYKNSLLKLSDEVAKKERLVTDYSLVSSKASWYLDQIGSSVPGSILLTDIEFQPLSKPLKKDAQVLFSEDRITIKGTSGNSDDFIKWTSNFEQTDWIQTVSIQDYGTGKRTNTAFELLIELK